MGQYFLDIWYIPRQRWVQWNIFLKYHFSQWCGSVDQDSHSEYGSGSRRIKLSEAEFNQQIYIFLRRPKEVADLWGLDIDLKIIFFSWFKKNWLKSIWWFYCNGSGSKYDQCGSTSLIMYSKNYKYIALNYCLGRCFHIY